MINLNLSVILSLLLLLLPVLAAAQSQTEIAVFSPYEVRGLAIDISRADDAQAKQEAQHIARARAFEILLERLVQRRDLQAQNPRLTETYRGEKLIPLIANLSISDEKFGSGRYLAEMTVRFKPSAMRALFAAHDLGYAETYSLPLLVLPLYEDNGTMRLWPEVNPLLQALQRAELGEGLLPYRVPYGDIEDVILLSLSEALDEDRSALAAIAARHAAYGILLLRVQRAGEQIRFDGRMFAASVVVDFPTLEYSFRGRGLAAVVQEALGAFQEEWKRENLIRGRTNILQALVEVRDLASLHILLRSIQQIAVVDEARFLRLSVRQAVMRIAYRASLKQLQTAMFNVGLRLDQRKSDGYWHIRDL